VWAPIRERQIALGHHRFEWLYVTGFVEPASGRTVWHVSKGLGAPHAITATVGHVSRTCPAGGVTDHVR
jgi:hypothetical protein